MGGLSTDSERRRQMWNEDIRLYKAHGFAARSTKLMKMMWKVPQFIRAFKMHSYHNVFHIDIFEKKGVRVTECRCTGHLHPFLRVTRVTEG